MIPRYSNANIAAIWSDEAKLERWQDTELAVIQARVNLGLIDQDVFDHSESALHLNPPDVGDWLARDKVLHHDLNAFIEERQRFIPSEFQSEFHKDMTSYDTEEPAFSRALIKSHALVDEQLEQLIGLLKEKARTYRYTLMLERTHGQWAKLRTFGSRLLTYIAELQVARNRLQYGVVECRNSKISGATGNYGGGLTPQLEEEALQILHLEPFFGATQIVPRIIFTVLAHALGDLCETLGKHALDFRLGARSGLPLWHEPFSKKQKGSSAMPHKKNTIRTEQMEGMVRLAKGYESAIVEGISTWEGRAIEQSCVERVAWPDLFHVTLRMLSVMTEVFEGMVVYSDNMLEEIVASRCTYASDEAKNFLAVEFGKRGLPAEDAYRIVQLASFCVFTPDPERRKIRDRVATSLEEAGNLLHTMTARQDMFPIVPNQNLRDIILEHRLFPISSLDAGEGMVNDWNEVLREIFEDADTRDGWRDLFMPSYLLRQEAHLFNYILCD